MLAFKGCRHCVTCCNLLRSLDVSKAWPAGISTPTVYFMLRERQLAFQCAAVAREGGAAWRQHSFSAGRSNELLARRGLPQLSVAVPLTRGGVDANESAVFVRTLVQSAAPAVVSAAAAAKAAAAAPQQRPLQPAQATPARHRSSSGASSRPPLVATCTPPQLLEQPAKRSRVTASPPPLQRQQQAQAPLRTACPGMAVRAAPAASAQLAHLIARSLSEQTAPVVISMPPSSASSCRSMAASPAAAAGGWLSRLRGMLTPQSRAC